jgi:hemolysin activation/secretion protein
MTRIAALVGLLVSIVPAIAADTPPLVVEPRAPALTTKPCFSVDKVLVHGLELLPPDEVSAKLSTTIPNCLDGKSVQQALVTLNAMHADRGYITTQAYLPKQDVKATRRLEIKVVTGRVGEVRYVESWNPEGYGVRVLTGLSRVASPSSLDGFFSDLDALVEALDDVAEAPQLLTSPELRSGTAIVLKSGDALELEAMQQGIDQINKAPSAKAKAKLDPGKEPATSTVTIVNAPNDALRMFAGYDSYGSEATGKDRYRTEIHRDNLIGVNDVWSSTLTSSDMTNELRGSVTLPFQWTTTTLSASYSELLLPLSDLAELWSQTATGEAATTWTILRTPARRADVSLTASTYANDRFVNDAALTPQRFTTLQAGVSGTWTLEQGALSASLSAKHGTTFMGATRDPAGASSSTPRAQFEKVRGNASLQLGLPLGLMMKSSIEAQWSNVALYSPEQFSIGSSSSVRGFDTAPFSGDRGFYSSLEISGRLPPMKPFESSWLGARLGAVEGFVFSDFGYAFDVANDNEDAMSSVGAGIRIRDSRLTVDLSYAQGVFRADKTKDVPHQVYVNVGLKTF